MLALIQHKPLVLGRDVLVRLNEAVPPRRRGMPLDQWLEATGKAEVMDG